MVYKAPAVPAQPQVLRHFAREAKVMVVAFRWVRWVYADPPEGSLDPSPRH